MNGARAAAPAEPRPAAPEPASRRRSDPVVLVPVSEPPVAAVAATRDRLQVALAGPPAPETPTGESAPMLTTRDRIANRARETEVAAVVVPAADVELRRQQRNAAAAPPAAPVDRPPAVVVPLRPRPEPQAAAPDAPATPARGPPAATPDSATAAARAPPGSEPEPALAVVVRPEPVAPAAPAEAAAPATPVAGTPSPAGATSGAPAAAQPGMPATPVAAAPVPVGPTPAATGLPAAPEESPLDAFRARADAAARGAKHHRPADKAAANAQAASAPNAVADVDRQAAEEQVEAMGEAQPGRFDPAAFKDALQKAIDGMAPPASEEEADDVEKATDPGPARDTIHGVVTTGRDAAEGDIKATTEAQLKRSDKEAKKPDKLVNDASHPALPPVAAADAMPVPKPEAAADFSTATGEIDAKMQENGLTQEQLASSNEPSFTAVLDARDAARANAAGAPAAYRDHEQTVLATARGEADAAGAPPLTGMHAGRAGVLTRVLDVKQKTRDSDAQQRDTVNRAILDIHKQTHDDVHTMLDALDTKVEQLFTAYEESARADFEADVGMKMQNYKDERYSGLSGLGHGIRDVARGLPKEVDQFYRDGRAKYLRAMERALDKLATRIVTGLFMAHVRILLGRAQVKTYVEETLPQSLRKLGRETAATLDHNFDTLESDIDAKRDELVQTIARKYVDAQTALDSRIDELKAENRGLIDKAIDATIGVAKAIYNLGKMLLRVLIKAAEAIGDIVAHPIRFLDNLIDAVGGGLGRFVDRIGVHLQETLVDLLFGELGSAGITMPGQLDFAGIVDLVLQVLGLTYGRIRERAVRHFGEPVVSRLEQTVDIFATLVKEGIGGLWAQIKEKLSDLEDLVIGKIKEYVIERVVTAGINYILALLTPVGAFIKACQTIYKIVMFIIEKAKEIADFVDSIMDSISAIAAGDVATAVLKVESALAGALKIAIKFLAELVNLGSLADKVRSIIELIRTPITKIVDAIIFGAGYIARKALVFVQGKLTPRRDEHGKEIVKKEVKPHEIQLAHADLPAVPAPAEHPVIHEPFVVAGERHEITDDGTGVLVVASDGSQPVAGIAELTTLNQRYRTLPLTAPQARRAEILRAMIELLKQHPALIVHARAQLQDPPNLGEVNRHGTNSGLAFRPKTERDVTPTPFAPLWEMESEHVLSVGAVSATLEAAGLGPKILRRSPEDKQMHTAMIYAGAARSKTGTTGDNADIDLIENHKNELRGVHEELDQLHASKHDPVVEEKKQDIVFGLLGHLNDWGEDAVRRTNLAVQDEHRAHAAERGGHPTDPPKPRAIAIRSAYRLQIGDIATIARDRVREI